MKTLVKNKLLSLLFIALSLTMVSCGNKKSSQGRINNRLSSSTSSSSIGGSYTYGEFINQNDEYTFNYFDELLSATKDPVRTMPGFNANNSDAEALFLGRVTVSCDVSVKEGNAVAGDFIELHLFHDAQDANKFESIHVPFTGWRELGTDYEMFFENANTRVKILGNIYGDTQGQYFQGTMSFQNKTSFDNNVNSNWFRHDLIMDEASDFLRCAQ